MTYQKKKKKSQKIKNHKKFHRYGIGCVHFRAEKWDMAEYHFRRACGIHPRSSVLRCYLGMAVARAAGAAAAARNSNNSNDEDPSAAAEFESKSRDAVRELSRAVELDGRNPLARFELSAALSSLGEVEAALSALLPLLAPGGGGGSGGSDGRGSGGGGGAAASASVFASSFSALSSPAAPSSSSAAREPAVWYQCARLLRRLGRLREARDKLVAALDLSPAPADAARIRAVLERCCAALAAQEERQRRREKGGGGGGGEEEEEGQQLYDDFDESSGDEL